MNIFLKPKFSSPTLTPSTPDTIEPSPVIADDGSKMSHPLLGNPEADGSEAGKWISEADYWAHYYNHPDFNYEWNNGILEVKPMADLSKAEMYLWFLELLRHFLNVKPIAKLTVLEIGFRLALAEKTTSRKPDIGVILNDNEMPMAQADRTYHGTYDICLESVSDSSQKEIDRDTVAKKGEYEGIGVQEYYILHDQRTETVFYELTEQGIYRPIPKQPGGVIASPVLPGFQFREEDLYRQPSWQEMIEDEVYQSFVLPEFVAEKNRADQERQRANQAEQAVILAKAATLSLLQRTLARQFNLADDHYNQILSHLDLSVLMTLSEQVFDLPDQAAFEAFLGSMPSEK